MLVDGCASLPLRLSASFHIGAMCNSEARVLGLGSESELGDHTLKGRVARYLF